MSQSLTHVIKRQTDTAWGGSLAAPTENHNCSLMAHPLLLQTKNSSHNQASHFPLLWATAVGNTRVKIQVTFKQEINISHLLLSP